MTLVPIRGDGQKALKPIQWLSFFAIGLTCIALTGLIWTLTSRMISDQTVELRRRTDQHVRSVAFVLAREIENELNLIDQSLAIIQDAWKKDSESVDLGAWRKRMLAVTAVAADMFIANEQRVIVQGTLPQSIGQGFGSAYVPFPNGSLEIFDPDGRKNPDGRIPGGFDRIEARQFIMYLARPLDMPRGWFVGASYRSEGITKLFAGADLGQNGTVGMVSRSRGILQAIVGTNAQIGEMDISRSELVALVRKNESGVWPGISPMDKVARVIGYQRVPGRDLAVIVGVSMDATLQPLIALAAAARGVALLGSLVVLVVGGLVIRNIATSAAEKARKRNLEHLSLNLMNTRKELGLARARTLLSDPEAGTLMSSGIDGVARLDKDLRLRLWNPRFAGLVCVPLDATAYGSPIETLWRRQAAAGVFGDPDTVEDEVSKRLTLVHTAGESIAPPEQIGPGGARIEMRVRGVADGGYILILTSPENARLAVLPASASEREPELAETGTEF